MNFFILAIGGLAVWRLSHAIVKETGMLMILSRMRAFLAQRQKHMGGLYDLVSCTSCVSFWLGLLAALGVAHDVFSWIMYGLSFSSISMLLEAHFTKNSDTLPLVTRPATNNKVAVGRSSTPK